jgi:hypothetical protein
MQNITIVASRAMSIGSPTSFHFAVHCVSKVGGALLGSFLSDLGTEASNSDRFRHMALAGISAGLGYCLGTLVRENAPATWIQRSRVKIAGTPVIPVAIACLRLNESRGVVTADYAAAAFFDGLWRSE